VSQVTFCQMIVPDAASQYMYSASAINARGLDHRTGVVRKQSTYMRLNVAGLLGHHSCTAGIELAGRVDMLTMYSPS